MNLVSYFQGVSTEIRKVTWPTVPTVVRHFLSVIAGVAFATALVGGLDYVFLRLLSFVLK